MFSTPLKWAGRGVLGLALCVATTPAAMANPACALSLQGCVLPVTDPPPVTTTTTTTTPVIVDEPSGGLGILPILAGLAALGLLAYLLLDDDEEPVSP